MLAGNVHFLGAFSPVLKTASGKGNRMPQQKFAPTWLNPFAGLIGRQRGAVPPAYRRLRGECLEDRMVLSTAALPVDTAQGQSLADYLAQAHSMGPALPAEPAA